VIWDKNRQPDEPQPVFPISEVVSTARSGQPAVMAVVGGEVVGMAVAQVNGAELGGQVMPPGLWQAMVGMEAEKQVVERRIVLPLAEPDLAAQYGVSPLKAVILFGPPGTGKTSFAKAVAGRLGWPFVELFPSRLATPDAAMSSALRDAFTTLMELESAVVFIDEVEEIAGSRSGAPSTNELLKLISAFRQHQERLLICATNSVRSLDPAFLRPRRFDYTIPVEPPDPDKTARVAIWRR